MGLEAADWRLFFGSRLKLNGLCYYYLSNSITNFIYQCSGSRQNGLSVINVHPSSKYENAPKMACNFYDVLFHDKIWTTRGGFELLRFNRQSEKMLPRGASILWLLKKPNKILGRDTQTLGNSTVRSTDWANSVLLKSVPIISALFS